jgi:hypothetical protein
VTHRRLRRAQWRFYCGLSSSHMVLERTMRKEHRKVPKADVYSSGCLVLGNQGLDSTPHRFVVPVMSDATKLRDRLSTYADEYVSCSCINTPVQYIFFSKH